MLKSTRRYSMKRRYFNSSYPSFYILYLCSLHMCITTYTHVSTRSAYSAAYEAAKLGLYYTAVLCILNLGLYYRAYVSQVINILNLCIHYRKSYSKLAVSIFYVLHKLSLKENEVEFPKLINDKKMEKIVENHL